MTLRVLVKSYVNVLFLSTKSVKLILYYISSLKVLKKFTAKISNCTTNIHIHLYLKQCLTNFGPAYDFWCSSFERYNVLLGIMYHPNIIKSMSHVVTMYKRINYLEDIYMSDHYRKGQNRDRYVKVF